MMQATMIVTASLLFMGGAAAAQDGASQAPAAPIVTRAPPSAAPIASTPSPAAPVQDGDSTGRQISAWIDDDRDGAAASVPGVISAMPAPRDRAIHGEVGASIGSGGYRSAYGVANMPLGEHSDVTVAIANEHLGGGDRGRGYGYRGGDRQSLGIALNLNGVARGASPADCASTPRWSLGLPDDAALSNRCRRMQQAEGSSSPSR